jgi:hypothetical protein
MGSSLGAVVNELAAVGDAFSVVWPNVSDAGALPDIVECSIVFVFSAGTFTVAVGSEVSGADPAIVAELEEMCLMSPVFFTFVLSAISDTGSDFFSCADNTSPLGIPEHEVIVHRLKEEMRWFPCLCQRCV